jgi:hypothetical protein
VSRTPMFREAGISRGETVATIEVPSAPAIRVSATVARQN